MTAFFLSLPGFLLTAQGVWIILHHYDAMCPRAALHQAHRIMEPPPHQPWRWCLGWWRSARAWVVVFRSDTARYRAWWIMWGSVALAVWHSAEIASGNAAPAIVPRLLEWVLWAIVHLHFNALLGRERDAVS